LLRRLLLLLHLGRGAFLTLFLALFTAFLALLLAVFPTGVAILGLAQGGERKGPYGRSGEQDFLDAHVTVSESADKKARPQIAFRMVMGW
jgi:hypothetical protein